MENKDVWVLILTRLFLLIGIISGFLYFIHIVYEKIHGICFPALDRSPRIFSVKFQKRIGHLGLATAIFGFGTMIFLAGMAEDSLSLKEPEIARRYILFLYWTLGSLGLLMAILGVRRFVYAQNYSDYGEQRLVQDIENEYRARRREIERIFSRNNKGG
jgi:hypothetical protein